jgi:chromosome segregation ATPase
MLLVQIENEKEKVKLLAAEVKSSTRYRPSRFLFEITVSRVIHKSACIYLYSEKLSMVLEKSETHAQRASESNVVEFTVYAELELLHSKCAKLESHVSEKEVQLVDLQSSLQQRLSDYELVEEELATTKQNMATFIKDNAQKDAKLTKAHADLTVARVELDVLDFKCGQLESTLSEKEATILDLQISLRQSSSESERLKEELESTKQKCEVFKTEDAQMEVDFTNARAELDSLNVKCLHLKSTMSEKEAKFTDLLRLEEELERTRQNVEMFKQDDARVDADLAKARAELDALNVKCLHLKSTMSEKEAKFLDLQSSLRKRLSEYARMEGENEKADVLKKEDAHKEADITRASAELESLRSQCKALESHVSEREAKILDLQRSLRKSASDYQRLEEELESTKQNVEIKSLKRHIEHKLLNMRYDELKSKLKDTENESKKSSGEHDSNETSDSKNDSTSWEWLWGYYS